MSDSDQIMWGRHPDGIEVTIIDRDTGSAVKGKTIVLTWRDIREMNAVREIFGPQTK